MQVSTRGTSLYKAAPHGRARPAGHSRTQAKASSQAKPKASQARRVWHVDLERWLIYINIYVKVKQGYQGNPTQGR